MATIKHYILTVKCSQLAFNELFEKFNKAVKNKQYKKFDYDDWCKIRKAMRERCSNVNNKIIPTSVHFNIGTKEVSIDETVSIFHFDDKSFGQFLVNELNPQFIICDIEVKETTDYVISTKPTMAELDWKRGITTNDKYYYKNIIKQYKKNVNKCDDMLIDTDKYSYTYTDGTAPNINLGYSTDSSIITNTVKPDSFTIDWNAPTSTTKPITNTTKPENPTLNNWLTTSNSYHIKINDGVVNAWPDEVSIETKIPCSDCKNYEKKDNEEKENKMKGFNFDFGKITNDSIRMSMYGMAVKNASGVWTAYDKGTGDLMDVDVFNFDGSNFLFKMPVAIKDIAVGDVVIHARKPMFVISKTEAGDLIAIDPVAGEKKTIMPSKNMFGFNFATKVVSLFDNLMGQAPTSENPFGNMWMLMLMDGKSDLKDIMITMMLMNQASGSTNTFNPIMLMLMNDSDMKDMAIPLMLMN